MAGIRTDASVYGPKPGILAPMPEPERGVAFVMDVSPDGQYFIYTHGQNVIIREVNDPTKVLVYSEHSSRVGAAKFSPTGKYIASGDDNGIIRVWAFTHPEHLLKVEVHALGGPIRDISWGPESKRILVVGGGQTKAKVFMWDTGSNLGDIIPLSKDANSCAMKPNRPYRCVYGGEDFTMQFYSGPPFKYTCSIKEHSNFVNCVRYAPDGSRFVSVSSDKRAIVYDGATAEVLGELNPSEMHSGSIYACSWSSDSTKLVTSSADKSIKLWDMSTLSCIATASIGNRIDDMQNSVVWVGDTIISLSLDGTLNYFSAADLAQLHRVSGHKAPILAIKYDRENGRIIAGDANGRVCVWAPNEEGSTAYEAAVVEGEVTCVDCASGKFATGGWDDTLRTGDVAAGAYTTSAAVGAQPKDLAIDPSNPSRVIVVTSSAVRVFVDGSLVHECSAVYEPTCVSVDGNSNLVAVGGKDKCIHVYSIGSDGSLEEVGLTAAISSPLSVIAFSPDGATIAAGDASREVFLYSAADRTALRSGKWRSHTTRVTALAWRPNGSLIATASSDRRICFWSPNEDRVVKMFDLAHTHPICSLTWESDNALWTNGIDGVVKRWEIDF